MVVLSCHLHREDKQFPAQAASAQLAAGEAAPAPGAAGGMGREFLGDSGGQRTPVQWGGGHPQSPDTYWDGGYFNARQQFPPKA